MNPSGRLVRADAFSLYDVPSAVQSPTWLIGIHAVFVLFMNLCKVDTLYTVGGHIVEAFSQAGVGDEHLQTYRHSPAFRVLLRVPLPERVPWRK